MALPVTEKTRVRTFEARFSNIPEKKSDILAWSAAMMSGNGTPAKGLTKIFDCELLYDLRFTTTPIHWRSLFNAGKIK